MEINVESFIKNYRKLVIAKNVKNKGDLSEIVETQLKCVGHLYQGSLLFTQNSDYLLAIEDSLNFHLEDIEEKENYSTCLKNAVILNSENLKSNLNKIDFKEILTSQLSCTGNHSAHYGSDSNLDKFNKIFQTLTPCSLMSEINETRGDNRTDTNVSNVQTLKHVSPISAICRINRNQNFEAQPDNSLTVPQNPTGFRTASEIFQSQNQQQKSHKENVKTDPSTLSTTGRKRNLGMKRTINSKFIPPVMRDIQQTIPNTSTPESSYPELTRLPNCNDPLKHFDPKMIEEIRSEIMEVPSSTTWADIAGLKHVKKIIEEVIVWPMRRPDLFVGLRSPPKGILLFGPPGTGKTLIGRCIAAESNSTFFSISASSIMSKWIGDAEKRVRALFAIARCHQPAVIFIDEVDSLLKQRGNDEHESSRRIKTEFLVNLDGVTTNNDDRVLIIGTTNRPQELDEAARRRFAKRLYIPLPDVETRMDLVSKLILNEKHNLDLKDYKEIAERSVRFSGADIKILCSEAALGPIRSIQSQSQIERISVEDIRPLTMEDFDDAFKKVTPSVAAEDLVPYVQWNITYGLKHLNE